MDDDLTFDPALRARISAELLSGEKVLWIGKPMPIRVVIQRGEPLLTYLLFVVIFGVWLFSCNFFGLSSVSIGSLQIPILSLFCIPVAGLALYLGYDYWLATQTVYGVTTRRAIIIERTLDGTSVLAYNIIPYIRRRVRANGSGDLIFATETYSPLIPSNFALNGGSYNRRYRNVGFFGIANVRRVEELMFDTFRPAQRSNADR